MLAGRWAVPIPDPAARGTLPLAGLSASAPALVDLLPGEIHPGRLAADLGRQGQTLRWIRLAPYDLDPLVMRTLAATIAAGAAAGRRWVVVIESDDHDSAGLLLSRIPGTGPAAAVPCALLLRYVTARRRRRLFAGHDPGPAAGTPLGGPVLERLVRGRPALRESVLDAGRGLPPEVVEQIVGRARDAGDLTAGLAGHLLRDVPPRTRTLLGFAAVLGYCHPRYRMLEPVLEESGGQPWWTRLDGGWLRFDPAWHRAVLAVCRSDRQPRVPLLGQLVGELTEDGAAGAAIELCLDAGYVGTASDLVEGLGPGLLAAGRPCAVRRWLRRLPWSERHRHRALAGLVRAACRTPDPGAPDLGGLDPGAPDPGVLGPIASDLATPGADAPDTAGSNPAALGAAGPDATALGAAGPDVVARGPAGAAAAVVRRPAGGAPLAIDARLLGPVEIMVGGRPVEHWHGRRGVLLLAYLLLRRRDAHPVPRDTLAVTFWPDASPGASRNRLHVTLYALRADLGTASRAAVVVFRRGYALNPELEVRLDTEEFEAALARGRGAQDLGDVDGALRGYREAAGRYRDDLLCDYPYDHWTLLPREHYRALMLEALGRSAQLAFDVDRYPEAVETGQRLLGLDFCREDLHRLLMRAYSRMGLPHLALRQFDSCARQLRRDLDIAPARETIELYQRIRARSPV